MLGFFKRNDGHQVSLVNHRFLRQQKKHLKKKKKGKKFKTELGVQNCTLCGVASDASDPLRDHAILKKPKLEKLTYRWGRASPSQVKGVVRRGPCYYCRRTHRATDKYSAMKARELETWVGETEENKKEFVDDKDTVVELLKEKGEGCRIAQSDFDRTPKVENVESDGERRVQAGIKMTEALFNEQYTEEERKQLHVKKESQTVPVAGKVENVIDLL